MRFLTNTETFPENSEITLISFALQSLNYTNSPNPLFDINVVSFYYKIPLIFGKGSNQAFLFYFSSNWIFNKVKIELIIIFDQIWIITNTYILYCYNSYFYEVNIFRFMYLVLSFFFLFYMRFFQGKCTFIFLTHQIPK